MRITKSQLRQIIKESIEEESKDENFLSSLDVLRIVMMAKREVEDARVLDGEVNLDKLHSHLTQLLKALPKVLKP